MYAKTSVGSKDTMQQFNYYGQTKLQDLDENDVIGLEKEIDYILRNQLLGSSPHMNKDYSGLNNIKIDGVSQPLPKKRTKTAGLQQRAKKKSSLLGKKDLMTTGEDTIQANDNIKYSQSQPYMQNDYIYT